MNKINGKTKSEKFILFEELLLVDENTPPMELYYDFVPPKLPLLPIQKSKGLITLVLDLDETLVHSSLDDPGSDDALFSPVLKDNINYCVYTLKRPGLDEFLDIVTKHFEVVIFTASVKEVYMLSLIHI